MKEITLAQRNVSLITEATREVNIKSPTLTT